MTQLSFGRRKAIEGKLRGQQQLSRPVAVPPPVGGLNRISGLTLMEPTDAIELENLIASTSGITVRPGYTNHAVNIGSTSTDVRTVMAFRDVTGDQTAAPRDRLFACTDQGIYDVTNSTAAPILMDIYDGLGGATVLSNGWQTKGTYAGWVSFVNFTTAAVANGKHYLVACDLINGYHIWDPDGGGANIGRWYKITQGNSGSTIEGINPTKLVQVCSWKGRLIFTEVDSSRAWYLTPGAIVGTGASKPVAIDMGSRFNVGGWLKGCYTWTYDGGAGIDDFLVAVSAGGDVVVWQGISPADSNFQIKGVWQLGSAPLGRRIASDYGGDILLLSASGVLPLSKLVAGGVEDDQQYLTYKIQPLVRNYFKNHGLEFGWSIHELNSYGLILLNGPPTLTGRPVQLVCASQTQAWAVFGDIPARHWESFRGKEYFSTNDGRVCVLQGNVDTVQNAANDFTENDIVWKSVSAYQSGDAPANWKRVHFVRPLFVSSQLPTYQVGVLFDFATKPPQTVDPPPNLVGSKWDTALWDVNVWGGGLITEQPIIGASGYGRWFAVTLSGRSRYETSVVGFDLIGEIGGML